MKSFLNGPRVIVCALLVAVTVACAPSLNTPTSTPPPASATKPAAQSAKLREPFTLSLGQTATLNSEDFSVRFEALLAESRCPRNVACVWQGQAQIALVAVHRGSTSPPLTATIVGERPQNDTRTVTWSGYAIELIALVPYPGDPKRGDGPQATLVITKS